MANYNENFSVGFYFEFSFEGGDTAFKEVSGISKELGVEEIESTGENRFKYRLPTLTTSGNLVLKRGITPKDSQLIKWCIDTLDNGLTNSIETKDISVNLLNSEGEVLMKWMFYKAYPVKYAVADLRSQDNEVLIETLELAYTYFDTKS